MKNYILIAGTMLITTIIASTKEVSNIDIIQPATTYHEVGDKIDSLNGVYVYHNGGVKNVWGRHVTEDGYNIGLKYQCVEFVKRYYYAHLNHKMPNPWGNAKDFFISTLPDGSLNPDRNLVQYVNPSQEKPRPDDILIYDEVPGNPYGHVAIVVDVYQDKIEIIQQNVDTASREIYQIIMQDGKYKIDHKDILGWLRKE